MTKQVHASSHFTFLQGRPEYVSSGRHNFLLCSGLCWCIECQHVGDKPSRTSTHSVVCRSVLFVAVICADLSRPAKPAHLPNAQHQARGWRLRHTIERTAVAQAHRRGGKMPFRTVSENYPAPPCDRLIFLFFDAFEKDRTENCCSPLRRFLSSFFFIKEKN